MKAHPQIFEFKPVGKAIYLQNRNAPPLSHIWFKTKEKIKADIALQHQLLAFASDYSLLLSATLPHRKNLDHKKMRSLRYGFIDTRYILNQNLMIDNRVIYANVNLDVYVANDPVVIKERKLKYNISKTKTIIYKKL